MQCHHFDAGECRSCTLLDIPRHRQVADSEARVKELLAPFVTSADPGADCADVTDLQAERSLGSEEATASDRSGVWLDPIQGREAGFRSRGKMAVAGTAAAPVLGLPGQPTTADLSDCPLYPPGVEQVLQGAKALIRRAQVPPYDVARRRGEIKNVLVTVTPDGEHFLRLVLRSQKALERIREHLPRLLEGHPSVVGVSANIHSEHTTAVEGPEEIQLAGSPTIAVHTGDVTLQARPQSFLQTNTEVAGELYRQAARWVAESLDTRPAAPEGGRQVWDLYCGLGGFALHVARAVPSAEVTGVEASPSAIEGAREAAAAEGLEVRFLAEDATAWARRQTSGEAGADGSTVPDVVIVNPPRRGIGPELAAWLESSGVPEVVYSSCNPATLATDLTAMPSLRIVAARYVDMFPHTEHAEVIVHLRRTA